MSGFSILLGVQKRTLLGQCYVAIKLQTTGLSAVPLFDDTH